MFVRFVVPDWINRQSKQPMGIIRAAFLIHDPALEELLQWFNDFLIVPKAAEKAVCWFKDTASLHISKAQEIANIVESYNVYTRMLLADSLGGIIYEDEYQIAKESLMDQQECKVLFKPETTREQADALIKRYSSEAKIDTFYEKKLIGCNEVTFGIVTLPIKDSTKLQDDPHVIRVEVITTFNGSKTCEGSCGCC